MTQRHAKCVSGGVSKRVAGPLLWIKTDDNERGLGTFEGGVPGQPGDEGGEAGAASPYVTNTGWNDHSGQSGQPGARCVTVTGCDEDCVNTYICSAKAQGTWKALINDCNTKVRDVLKACGCNNTCLEWKIESNPRSWGGLNNTSGSTTPKRVCAEWLF